MNDTKERSGVKASLQWSSVIVKCWNIPLFLCFMKVNVWTHGRWDTLHWWNIYGGLLQKGSWTIGVFFLKTRQLAIRVSFKHVYCSVTRTSKRHNGVTVTQCLSQFINLSQKYHHSLLATQCQLNSKEHCPYQIKYYSKSLFDRFKITE